MIFFDHDEVIKIFPAFNSQNTQAITTGILSNLSNIHVSILTYLQKRKSDSNQILLVCLAISLRYNGASIVIIYKKCNLV